MREAPGFASWFEAGVDKILAKTVAARDFLENIDTIPRDPHVHLQCVYYRQTRDWVSREYAVHDGIVPAQAMLQHAQSKAFPGDGGRRRSGCVHYV